MMRGKTIMVLGGGVGGLVAANELRRRLGNEHRTVLVEKDAYHAFAPSFPWLMAGYRQAAQITRPVDRLVRPGVEVIHATVIGLDLSNRQVVTDAQGLAYDYLIIALGAELAPETIPGLSEAAHTFFSLEGTSRLHEALKTFAGGTVAVVVAAVPYKCPGAPHEGAMLLADFMRRRGLRDKVDLHLFTPEAQPMPTAGPKLGEALRQMLSAKGITFHPQHKLTAVNTAARQLVFEGMAPVAFDMLVAIPPHRAPGFVREAGLANEAGWIPVDRATLATRQENVYAVGDVTALPIPGRWKPDVPLLLPKAGVFAHGQALVVARRLATEITGAQSYETFDGEGFCTLEAGGGQAGFAFGNFFAEPSPEIQLRRIGRVWHIGKVLFEQWWLAPVGPRREMLRLMLALGGKSLGIPVIL
jgi:sulfide:quinone oxidoreductase